MIVVAGEALVDVVIGPDGTVVATPGGAPFNVARACGRLGADVALAASISLDAHGESLFQLLIDDDVDVAMVMRTERPTTVAEARLDGDGVAHYEFRLTGTAAPELTTIELPPMPSAVFTGGLGLVLEPMAAAVEAMVGRAATDTMVVLDLNCRPSAVVDAAGYRARLRRVAARADVVKASEEDLAYLFPAIDTPTGARHLLGWSAGIVVVTAGGEATTIVDHLGEQVVGVRPAAVIDTIGAGDSFAAGFVTWWIGSGRTRADLADRAAVTRAVEAGHEVAAIVVGRRGADPPWRSELPDGWSE